jgi:hypothetical protein
MKLNPRVSSIADFDYEDFGWLDMRRIPHQGRGLSVIISLIGNGSRPGHWRIGFLPWHLTADLETLSWATTDISLSVERLTHPWPAAASEDDDHHHS